MVRPLARAVVWLALILGVLACPRDARAWTDATVRSVSARVTIAPDASAEVELVAQVRVDGGWLQAFELDGLDPDLALIPERASFREAAGPRLEPRIEVEGEGRVVYGFRRRSAPRRGDYVATLAYRTSLATRATELREADDTVHVRWLLPGWRYGLDDVTITVDAPAGAVPVRDEDDPAVEVSHAPTAQGTRVVFHRVHLPRTREWTVTLAVPASQMDASLRASAPPRRPPPAPPAEAPRSPLGLPALALALALIALAKIAAVAREERRARVEGSALVPLGAPARAVLVIALAIAAGLGSEHVELAIAALGLVALCALHRRGGAPRAPRLGSFRATTRADHARARAMLRGTRFGLVALVDPTTVPGAALLGGVVAAPVMAWSRGALPVALPVAMVVSALAAAVLLGGTRRSRPAAPEVELAHLLALAARTRADLGDARGWALRPVLHTDVRGGAQDARLRVVLAGTPKGLLRLDVVRAARADRGGWSSEAVLLVVAREGSPADRAIGERFPGSVVASAPRRVARQLAIAPDLAGTLAPVLEALAGCPVEAAAAARSAPELAASA